MPKGFRLRTLGILWVLFAFAAGLMSAWLWFASIQNWNQHLSRGYIAGFSVYDVLRTGAHPPEGVIITPLGPAAHDLADNGEFSRLPDLPQPVLFTNVSILAEPTGLQRGDALSLVVASSDLRYPVADLVSDGAQSAAEKLGNLTRLLATYCSEPIIFAQMGDADWVRVDGTAIWGCNAAPFDLRLFAALAAFVALSIILTLVADASSYFDRFAQALKSHRRLGGPERYSTEGPEELRDIVLAVNSYLEIEREQLSKRAIVLSAVSHDLGTPATRLRLRAALIQDAELREKLEADIDSMTGMIESVLTYTRSELSVEVPRQLSLTALVEALVSDYQDMGKPVEFHQTAPTVMRGGHSVFMSRSGRGAVPDARRVLVTARPVSLQRAVSNLIDNALKYGRRATVELEAASDIAVITVEDEGSEFSVEDIKSVFAPFQRGPNTKAIDGFGLGLTIVSTVAEQHGGTLTFEEGVHGLRARLEICRN